MTEPLSPAARAVLYVAHNRWLNVDDDIPAQVAAAALRATAEQLGYGKTDSLVVSCEDILAIAAELEGSND